MEREFSAENPGDKPSEQQMAQIESDLRVTAASGYSIDELDLPEMKNIPMTVELQRLVNEIKLSTHAKEIEEANWQQWQLANNEKDSEAKQASDNLIQAMQNAATREWMSNQVSGIIMNRH